jgi:hypothetical protein
MKSRVSHAHRIAKEYDGILPYHEIFYIRSIRFSTGRALTAFARYAEALKSPQSETRSEDLVFGLYEAIGHCAAVSRYFWPTSEEKLPVARATRLREAFGMNDDDPLYRVRSIRNGVEHFDERLDRFCAKDPVGTIFDLVVDSEDLVDEQVTHVLRLVDPAAQTVVLFGKKYCFAGLQSSIERIQQAAEKMDRMGGRLDPGVR